MNFKKINKFLQRSNPQIKIAISEYKTACSRSWRQNLYGTFHIIIKF